MVVRIHQPLAVPWHYGLPRHRRFLYKEVHRKYAHKSHGVIEISTTWVWRVFAFGLQHSQNAFMRSIVIIIVREQWGKYNIVKLRGYKERLATTKYIFQPFPIIWIVRNFSIHVEKGSSICLAIMSCPNKGYGCDLSMIVWCKLKRMVVVEMVVLSKLFVTTLVVLEDVCRICTSLKNSQLPEN